MKVSSNFKSNYPKLADWLEKEIPSVSGKHRVWQAFLKFSELTPAKAKLAIKPGSFPEVHYRVMPGANGQYSGGTTVNRVYLAKSICDRFESKDSANPKMHKLIESTLLHEMVHWGDYKDGKDQVGEEGKAFEKAAYGKDINRHW